MVDSLSEDDFRKALYESLNKKGIVSTFKSHLRQQLAAQLAGKIKNPATRGPGSELVGDMLTAAHLKYSEYEYSLSTFLSEANVSMKGLNVTEWLRLMNVSEDSALGRLLTEEDRPSHSPLLLFIEAVVKTCGRRVENAGIQTEATSLEEKLNQLDEKYSSLPADYFLSPQDKQLQGIYADNKNIQEVVKLEIERFKELELERYKLLERDRVNKEFNKKLAEFETEYRQRLDSLHRREVESARAHDKMKADTEAALYKERQHLLSELESLRSRSQQMEREQSVTKSQVTLEQEKVAIMTARLEERETAIASKEEDLKNKLQEHLEKARLQCKAELRSREASIAAKESQLKEDTEERMRIGSALEAHQAEVKTLSKDNADLNDRVILLEAQLDAARSQTLHYEAKLAVTSDYEQIKNNVISLETERKHLLESFEKERGLAQRSEQQLREIISSLREQLARPSQNETDAINELQNFKQKHFRETDLLNKQIVQVRGELEREQKNRVAAQTELRDQFLECRAHHTAPAPTQPVTDMPDFLKKYLSSVRLDDESEIADPDNTVSDRSNPLLSEMSTSSDSILRPTKSIVANSRKLFDQLEREEQELEREFANFRSANSGEFTQLLDGGVLVDQGGAMMNPVSKTVQFQTPAINPAKNTIAPQSNLEVNDEKPRSPVNPPRSTFLTAPQQSSEPSEPSTQSTLTPPRPAPAVVPSSAAVEPDIMANLDPVMQGYLNRVLESKKKEPVNPEPAADNSSKIEQEVVEFDKTDSDFSW